MRHRVMAALALSLLFSSRSAHADTIDNLVWATMERLHIPGLSLAIAHEGKVIKRKGYGLANREWHVPAAPDTVYQIGSITKTFTSTAILMLCQEDKLKLDDTLGEILLEAPPAWRQVTIRHLLQHTGGIPGEIGVEGMDRLIRDRFTPIRALALFQNVPLQFEPGWKWEYSNMGYYLLGLVIERKAGMAYDRFLQERIFAPLRMSRTCANDPAKLVPNRAAGYDFDGTNYRNAEPVPPAVPYSAGYLLSTVDDLLKWGETLESGRLLTPAWASVAWKPTLLNDGRANDYGLGWILGKARSRPYFGHSGGIRGFSSFFVRFPEQKLTVVILSNTETGLGQLAFHIASTVLPDPAGTQSVALQLKGFDKAKQVAIAGEFNDWDPTPMHKKNGLWQARIRVPRGQYAYKFVVDGEWITDPANPKSKVDGEYTNSLLTVP